MTSKLSITVSLTIASNTAQIAVSGTLTAENAPTVIAVARRVSGLDGGFDILIDISGLSRSEVGALQALQAGGFRIFAPAGQESRPSRRRAAAVPA
jgi:conjugal transfer/entry exclusion protein